ncbi:MAG: hypothetical protein Tsb0021_03310 [Chlamydiales bacterium]
MSVNAVLKKCIYEGQYINTFQKKRYKLLAFTFALAICVVAAKVFSVLSFTFLILSSVTLIVYHQKKWAKIPTEKKIDRVVNDIRIFFDECSGVNFGSAQDLKTIMEHYFPNATCRYIDSRSLKESDWDQHTDVLVIPGGIFSKMKESLGESTLIKVHQYVLENKRKLLCFCAGAYGFSRSSHFKLKNHEGALDQDSQSIERDNSLWSVFEGKALGPFYDTFCLTDPKSFYAAEIYSEEGKGNVYFQGGCTFEGFSENEVLARYREGNPAILCLENRVILSGVHPESLMKDTSFADSELNEKVKKIQDSHPYIDRLWRKIFSSLDIQAA